MISLINNKKCLHIDCKVHPSFNFKNEDKALYCVIHKKEEMVDVIHKKCIYQDCNTRPSFNFKNE